MCAIIPQEKRMLAKVVNERCKQMASMHWKQYALDTVCNGHSWPVCTGQNWPVCTGKNWPVCTGHSWLVCTGHGWPVCTGHSWPVCTGHNHSMPRNGHGKKNSIYLFFRSLNLSIGKVTNEP